MSGRDIFGNLFSKNIHGNAADTTVHGERPKDSAGNAPKDIFGNETTAEEKKEE